MDTRSSENRSATPPPQAGADASPKPEDDLTSADRLAGLAGEFQDRFDHAKRYLFEMAEYGSHLVRVRLDRAMLSFRTMLIWLGVGIVLAITGVSALVYGTVLLLNGVAAGLGVAFGRPWLGTLVTGLLVVGAGVIGVMTVGSMLVGKTRIALHAKYEARKAAQRQHFGRDVTDAAAGAPADLAARGI